MTTVARRTVLVHTLLAVNLVLSFLTLGCSPSTWVRLTEVSAQRAPSNARVPLFTSH